MPDMDTISIKVTGESAGVSRSLNTLIKKLESLRKQTSDGAGLSRVSNDLAKLQQQLNGTNNAMNRLAKIGGGSRGGRGLLGGIVSLATKYFTADYLARGLSNAVELSSDYTENVNMFSVAMGEYAQEAMNYALEVENALGIDPSEWVRAQGVFQTLATGFGVTADRANSMSRNLTQLGYDISSFFNISVADAMQKLQSGISGEIEPLRRLGYDLSQAKLEAVALSLGIDKSVSSMTQAEKAELRYVAIMTQVTTAQGDLARTLYSPANQFRILTAQVQMAGRALGDLFIPIINNVLPYLIAAAKAVRILAASLASLFGGKVSGSIGDVSTSIGDVSTSIGNVSSGIGGVTDGLNGASGAAKKLKGQLAGFDELNIIQSEVGGGGGGGGGSVGGGGGGFDFDIGDYGYDFIGDAVKTRVDEILDRWMPKIEWIKDHANQIFATVGLIGGALLAYKFSSGFLGGLNALNAFLGGGAAAVGDSAGSGWLTRFGKILGGLTLAITGFSLAFSAEANDLDGERSPIEALKIAIGNALGIGGSTLTFLGLGASGVLSFGISIIIAAAVGVTAAVVNHKKTVQKLVEESHAHQVASDLEQTITKIFSVDSVAEVALLPQSTTITHEDYTDLVNMRARAYEQLTIEMRLNSEAEQTLAYWNGVLAQVDGGNLGILDQLGLTYVEVTERQSYYADKVEAGTKKIAELNDVIEVADYALETFGTTTGSVGVNVSELNSEMTVYSARTLDATDRTRMLRPEIAAINDSLAVQKQKFKESGEASKTFADDVDWARMRVAELAPVVKKSIDGKGVGDSFSSDFISQAANKIKNSSAIMNALKSAMVAKSIKLSVESAGAGFVKVRGYAQGGFPDIGQLFMAREGGPEMVGQIGSRTAVANNDQIVSGIANGVAAANESQNALLAEQNALLRAILEKEGRVVLGRDANTGRAISQALNAYNVARGAV